jgi:hypothetical protein
MSKEIDPKAAVLAIEDIRDILYLETDEETDKPVLNPDKEWDVGMLERIAEVIQIVAPVTKKEEA